MFESVLVANRGEIAVRVFRTLRRLGVRSIAVFSDADRSARHVQEADAAIHIGPTPPAESYLNIDRILAAASGCGAQAVHPGYGFLAENADFARACANAGVVFIGPSSHSIELMGDKVRAKRTVAAADVPVVPGPIEPGMSDEELIRSAWEIGFPVLVKPSAGGGGKGMHLITEPGQLGEALVTARREARSSFGDDTLFLERFIFRPRHIEVQVLGDTYGTTVHLGERECSLQRRHQKVVEEAPSPLLNDATRDRLGSCAVAAAKSVEYTGVGTVEFVVSSNAPDDFYFIEMNTRLQVEHPVTEMVTGLDLVEQQLRIAAGQPLESRVLDARAHGHAIEARVYAEDASRGFLPSGGRVLALREPNGEGVRVDSSLLAGLDIATAYDPLLEKIIAWGIDRESALARLREALASTVLLGVTTNLSFLGALIAHPDVVAGNLETGLIERELEALIEREPTTSAYAAYGLTRLLDMGPSGPVVDAWEVPNGWRELRAIPISFAIRVGAGAPLKLTLSGPPEHAELRVAGADSVPVSLSSAADGFLVSVGDATHHAWIADDGATRWVFVDGHAWAFVEVPVTRRRGSAGTVEREVRSPMPGRVIDVKVGQGDEVVSGQALVVIEAMKMEHQMTAPHDGVVDIRVHLNDSVLVDEVVAHIEPVVDSDTDQGAAP